MIRSTALAMGAWAEAITGDPDEAERLLARGPARRWARAGESLSSRITSVTPVRLRSSAAAGSARATHHKRPPATRQSGSAAPTWHAAAGSTRRACAACAGEFERALGFVDRGEPHTRRSAADLVRGSLPRRPRTTSSRGSADCTRRGRPPSRRRPQRSAPTLRSCARPAEHDQGMIALALADHARAAELLGAALVARRPA